MGKIEGDDPITPQMRETYRNEFHRAADLFQKSLVEFHNTKPDEVQKKAMFKDVMDKALNVMNETIKAHLGDSATIQTKGLAADYQNLLAEESKHNYEKLKNDIDNIQKYTK